MFSEISPINRLSCSKLPNSININVFKKDLSAGINVLAQLLFVRSYHYYIEYPLYTAETENKYLADH